MSVLADSYTNEQQLLPQNIVLAADPWCPHNCVAGSAREGYMVDIARQAFALRGIEVNYVNMSWARALQEARSNHIDGVIGAFKGDAKDFVFPQESLGLSKTEFFTHQNSEWKYAGLDSLKNLRLLTITNYFYAPDINAYINKNRQNQNRILELSGEKPLPQALALIQQQRAHLLLEDSQVMAWTLRRQQNPPALRSAGKVYCAPIYAAFAPSNPHAKELARILSDGVRYLRATGELTRIYKSYGLGDDWKARMVSPEGVLNTSSP
ncbi:MAG: transporter substrate-binding domain-containing protein [Marinobacter sp.]